MAKSIIFLIIGIVGIFFGYRLYGMAYTNKFFTSFNKKLLGAIIFLVGFLITIGSIFFVSIITGMLPFKM